MRNNCERLCRDTEDLRIGLLHAVLERKHVGVDETVETCCSELGSEIEVDVRNHGGRDALVTEGVQRVGDVREERVVVRLEVKVVEDRGKLVVEPCRTEPEQGRFAVP